MQLKYGPYSPSRLETATCGHSFYRQYVDPERANRPKIEGVAQARGSAVHEIYEKITERFCSGADPVFSDDEVRQWVTEAVGRHPPAYAEVAEIIDMAQRYIRRPPKVLVADASIELKLAVKLVNGRFEECDYLDPEAFARGKADIMMISDDTTTALVYDHKTQPNVEAADTFQLGFYAWVIWKMHPYLSRIETVLHFARYGTYSEPFVWTTEDLMKIEDEILTRVSIIESRQSWEATPNKMCQYCPFIAECPAMQEFIYMDDGGMVRPMPQNYKILGSTEKAVKLAGALNVFEDIVKQVKAELKDHVEMYGPIAIPGKIYRFSGKEGINWAGVNKSLREATYAVFEKYGVDPKSFMSFNQTASSHVWLLENEGLIKELSALFPRKTETEFRGYKA